MARVSSFGRARCAGVLIFAVRLIWSSRHVARLRRDGDAAEASLAQTVLRLARRMSIDRPVGVRISSLADSRLAKALLSTYTEALPSPAK